MSAKNNSRMKRFILRGVLDGIRSSVSNQQKPETEIEETLRSEHFQVCKTIRHGFPYQPMCLAFDPIQHLLAIGSKNGSLRIFGRPGVDCHVSHDGDPSIIQILFLINEGALVTVCSNNTLYLWTIRQKRPEVVHSLKFQRESITCCHLPFQSKWLYIGTEKGNVHIVNIESFILSGYIINWNKAIELSRKTHPGQVVHLSDNPCDPNKLLIGFESGAIVLWDLKSKTAETRFNSHEAGLRSISWHFEGKSFMCSHADGSITTWVTKNPQKPQNILYPHAKIGSDSKPEPCKPIPRLAWKQCRNGESYTIFSGGMPYEKGRAPCITVIHGKSTTVLEMEHNIADFCVLCESPWQNDFHEPYGIIVLLENDLVVVDLLTPGYPCFENPYPMDIHESPVTACSYYADCPPDLIPAFYNVGSKQRKSGFSENDWPVKGGDWGQTTCSYPEIIITGHADGSVKFWDASSVTLQVLYKLKTAKLFERQKNTGQEEDEDPYAVQFIYLDAESRMVVIAGLTHVAVFKYCKHENTSDVSVLDISILYEVNDELDSPEYEYPKPSIGNVPQHHSSSVGSYSSTTSDSNKAETMTCVKVKQGPRKWSAGYQPDVVCLLTYVDGEPPSNITSVSLNSIYGLLAFGNESGLAIVDLIQKTCLLNMGTPDLYGSMDPYPRAPRSPKMKKSQLQQDQNQSSTEEAKSPTTDQMNGVCLSPTNAKQRNKPQHPPELRRAISQDKNDGSFSRSRSSSMSSLENISKEAIQCLVFADSYTRKTDAFTQPCLWVGTSLGSVIVIVLQLPQSPESRTKEPVIVSPSGTIFRLKGAIMTMSFLDCNGVLIPNVSEQWNDAREMSRRDKASSMLQYRQMSVNKPKMSPTSSTEVIDRQFVVICSEKQARVMSLPSQTCAYKMKITESSFVVKAEVASIKDSVCLIVYAANGHIMAFSLPSLKILMDVDIVPLNDVRIAKTLSISNNGHALYFCSPSEVQKLFLSAELCENLQEMLGELFLLCETPEAPKQGFFKNLFGGGNNSLDREDLFGESSGKASKGVAQYSAGTGLSQAQGQAGAVVSEIHKTKLLLDERGQRLGELEERTQQMMMSAETFAGTANQLMLKYKEKKWYQL
ncbi:syntaxin-binding protein 5-like [Tubulanus polymorphus]|uniref:syntaxin-binding protein 5-like n=1 Tax=Tubulanus polymorphus TaxID=672921 RepID=UPI003DA51B99